MTWLLLLLLAAALLGWYFVERARRRTHAVSEGLHPEIDLAHESTWELYHNDFSLCSKKVRICLAELGIDYRSHRVELIETGAYGNLAADFLAVNTGVATQRFIRQAHARGRDVYVWTVNDPMSMVRMLWIGVDGLITDDPALVREVVAAYNDLSIPERFILAIGHFASVTIAPEKEEDLRP